MMSRRVRDSQWAFEAACFPKGATTRYTRGDVNSAEDHTTATRAVGGGDRVCTRGGLRVDADPDEVGGVALPRKIDRIEPIIAKRELDIVRRVRREGLGPERLDVGRILV